MLPLNATSVVQPLDQGIIRSVKRRYNKKLAERYLVSVENNKDANTLKQLDIVVATNMVANAWKQMNSTIIQNCFHKVRFKHHDVDPDPVPEELASEPEAPTTQPMMDEVIINLIHTENDAPQEESEDETPPAKLIKSTNEFLVIVDQQRAFMKRNNIPVDYLCGFSISGRKWLLYTVAFGGLDIRAQHFCSAFPSHYLFPSVTLL